MERRESKQKWREQEGASCAEAPPVAWAAANRCCWPEHCTAQHSTACPHVRTDGVADVVAAVRKAVGAAGEDLQELEHALSPPVKAFAVVVQGVDVFISLDNLWTSRAGGERGEEGGIRA
jgi:hypothetical protein